MFHLNVTPDPSNFQDTLAQDDLQQRLGLYQVFLKLYEHHRGLLDEILSLENGGSKTLARVLLPYVQGVDLGKEVFLMTNLVRGKSRMLKQPQKIWTIGRDPQKVAVSVQDSRLSRCHAAIRYTDSKGFQLIDLNSSNGTYVNGEPIRRIASLSDGDRIRLGSLSFVFFLCKVEQSLSTLPEELLAQVEAIANPALKTISPPERSPKSGAPEPLHSVNPFEDTLQFRKWGPFTDS